MRLTRLKIDKFRAIRDADIRIGDELALVGQNSAGKTSVLRALNAFFNFEQERAAFETGQHSFAKTAFAVIDLTFAETPADCKIDRVSAGSGEVRARLRYRKTAQWQVLKGRDWVAAPQDLHQELQRFISYAFIPLRRDHHIAGWGPDGLMERVVDAWMASNRQRDHITPGIQRLSEKIRNGPLDGLARQLRKNTPLNGKFDFTLEYETNPDYSVLLRDLILHVREGTQMVRLADSGSGTQSMAVFALYSYLAELENSTYILGFEEPEQNLHPQAQNQLLANLKSLDLQVIFTTHSSTMIDALDHEQVVLCRRVRSSTRDIETRITQLPEDFFASKGIDRTAYYKFHGRRNSEFFFADFVVVTESPIDAAVISEVLVDSGVSMEDLNMTVLSLDGVENLENVFHLLRTLDIASAFVVDKDYFLPYTGPTLKESRDARGFPRYAPELKPDTVAEHLFPRESDRLTLLTLLMDNHSAAMEMLAKVDFFCFRWSLEIDLIAAATPRERLYDLCSLYRSDKRTTEELLVNRTKQIKRQDILIPAISGLQPKQLPNSYKLLRRSLPAKAAAAT
ncbi:ATP-dependent endonuclease [Paenarthrobacter sp. TYUT067]|uniref:ATP-dependent nuclease n=1 Tax=Paenarthrobacter sp. TYUT067 TaxID=2926245 RepID=UPI00202F7D98|nr:AAA family ATPase [Paenarthrobacter sp. TYUT067]